MTAKVSYSNLLAGLDSSMEKLLGSCAGHLWENLPQDAADQRLGCQSPLFTSAESYVDNLPFAIDGTESVPEGLKDVSVDADKSVFVYCSKAEAGN